MYQIDKIEEPDEKAQLVEAILKDLPEWFGIDEATQWYIDQAKVNACFAVFVMNEAAGFITLSNTSEDCAEIVCMGVKKKFHGKGIGTLLVAEAERFSLKNYRYIQVKTVNEGHYKEYDATNKFYQHCGFKKLEVFPTLWDEHNPCLIWIKSLHS